MPKVIVQTYGLANPEIVVPTESGEVVKSGGPKPPVNAQLLARTTNVSPVFPRMSKLTKRVFTTSSRRLETALVHVPVEQLTDISLGVGMGGYGDATADPGNPKESAKPAIKAPMARLLRGKEGLEVVSTLELCGLPRHIPNRT